jgi:hypothetical protein
MTVPAVIADFFRLKNERDDQGLVSLFTEDAMVVDGGEAKTMKSRKKIQGWIEKSISGLNLRTEIKGAEKRNDQWIIDTVMTGDFKASPARFQYTITLQSGKIAYLNVQFLGSLK